MMKTTKREVFKAKNQMRVFFGHIAVTIKIGLTEINVQIFLRTFKDKNICRD